MSYRCQICSDAVAPGKKLLRHVVKRPNGQIAREVAVCLKCLDLLGVYPLEVVHKMRAQRVEPSIAVASLPRHEALGAALPIKPVVFK